MLVAPYLRFFLFLLAVAFATAATSSLSAAERLRIVAANLTSGNGQDYDPGHGNRILQGLRPDIVLVQEFNYLGNSAADIRSWVDTNFGASFSYVRETNPGQIPNGIVSRYPIITSGSWTDAKVGNRKFVWARIDIPGDKDLWAISVHLLTTSSANRNAQASQILDYIAAQGIPASDYVTLGGDFNTDSRSESALGTLSAYFTTSGPWPVDQAGNGNTNANRNKPYDWVVADAELHALRTPVVLGANSFPNGLVFDSRVYTPLPSPVLIGDSAATNMQHQAVVRDFLIPTTSAPSVPAIFSATTAEAITGQSFTYQIAATPSPISFGASGLPAGLSIHPTTGLISGTPTAAGSATITLSATNAAGTGTATLVLTVTAPGGGGTNGAVLLDENFAGLTTGDNTSTGGSSSAWNGNATSFPTVVRAFQAGGAVRLGSGSGTGSLTSKTLDLSGGGGAFSVSFKVKGWTSIEGDIVVSVTGLTPQTITYTATIGAAFEAKTLNFTGGTANSTVTLATSTGRAFIDDVVISVASTTPTLAVVGTLAPVDTVYGDASPSPASLTVSGTHLTAPILISAPTGFEVSQSPGGTTGYSTSQTLAAPSGTVAPTTVYLRLASTTGAGTYLGNVLCSSIGASGINVPVAPSTVARRALVVTAQDRTKAFGSPFATGTSAFTASGLVPGQTIGSVTLTAVGGTETFAAAGTYAIVSSDATGGTFLADNYRISYEPGTLHVTAPDFAEWADGLSDPDPAADPDGDGIVNLLEYYFGLEAASRDAFAPALASVTDGTELLFDYRRNKAAVGVTGTVEATTELSGDTVWSPADVLSDVLLQDFDLYETRRATIAVNPGETRKFVRLSVTSP